MAENHENRKRLGKSQKVILVALAFVLAIGCAIAGTVAWLVADSGPVENTFTYGDINIRLAEEHKGPFKIVPGCDITKDPVVTVEANSEDCFLFVKVDEENWPDFKETDGTPKVSYALTGGWTELKDGVYYREVSNSNAAQTFSVLENDVVIVSEHLTKKEIDGLSDSEKEPKLTFTAYAVQKYKSAGTPFTATAAWEKVDTTAVQP